MRYLIIFFSMVAITGCIKKQPKNLIPKEKMEHVLWDYLKNDIYTFDHLKDSLHRDTIYNINMQKKLFFKYKISKKEFYDSYNYYSSKPALLKEILDSITVKEKRKDEAAKTDLLPVVGM